MLHVGIQQFANRRTTLQPVGVIDLVRQLVCMDSYLISVIAGQIDLQDHHAEKLQHGHELPGIVPDTHMLQAISAEADDQGTQDDLRQNVGRNDILAGLGEPIKI